MCSRGYLVWIAAVLTVLSATAQEDGSRLSLGKEDGELEASADEYNFDPNTRVLQASGNVRIGYGDLRLRADSVRVDAASGAVEAAGDVRFWTRNDRLQWRGKKVEGNLESKRFDFGSSHGRLRQWHYRVDDAGHSAEGMLTLQGVVLSTCDQVEQPGRHGHYSVRAKRVKSWPDGRYQAYGPTFRVGGLPFFWLPYLAGNVNRAQGWHVKAGIDEDPGAFVFVEREFSIAEHGRSQAMVHLRQNNGLALGNDLYWDTPSSNSRLLLYGLHDNEPPGSGSGPHQGYNQGFDRVEDRYRLRLKHRQRLAEAWELWAQLEWHSDVDMLEDFFESEYERSPSPASYVELRRSGDIWNAALRLEGRVNDFDSAVQRLPQLSVTVPRRPLGGLGLEYEGTASAGWYERAWRDYDDPNLGHPLPEDYESSRADTLHMLYRPFRLGALNLVPRLGGRVTWYGESSSGPAGSEENLRRMFDADDPLDPYNGPAAAGPDRLRSYDEDRGSVTRLAGELGLELSMTFYRTRPNAYNRLFRVDGLRHVLEPYANYTYAPEPSEEREFLYFFDEVDRLTEQNFVRVGLRQELQTRRDDRIHELATLDTYADLHAEETAGRGHAGDAGVKASFHPAANLGVDFNGIVDMDSGGVRLASLSGHFGKRESLSVSLDYSYRDDGGSRSYYAMGANLASPLSREWWPNEYTQSEEITATASYPFNPRTRLTLGMEFDMVRQDSAETFARLTRQFHCLMGSVTLAQDNDDDLSLIFYVWIKDYPRFGVSTSSG